MPYAIATPEQTRAKRTAWSLKKSIKEPPTTVAPVRPGAAVFYHSGRSGGRRGFLGRSGVCELQVCEHLAEVAQRLLGDRAVEHRDQRAERLDREPRLVEVAGVPAQPVIAERG